MEKKAGKKNTKQIVIESIPGNRSGEQAEFISALQSSLAGTAIRCAYDYFFVFFSIMLWTLKTPL